MKKPLITETGLTVGESRAKRFTDLVEAGMVVKKAAKTAGMTLQALKEAGTLAESCRNLLARTEADRLLEKKTRESVARARLLELMMQDTDLKVALGAAKAELDSGRGPGVAIQINNTLRYDPEVIKSLQTLQLEVEKDEADEG